VGSESAGAGENRPVPAVSKEPNRPGGAACCDRRDGSAGSAGVRGLQLEASDHERHQGLPAVDAQATAQGAPVVEEAFVRQKLADGSIARIEQLQQGVKQKGQRIDGRQQSRDWRFRVVSTRLGAKPRQTWAAAKSENSACGYAPEGSLGCAVMARTRLGSGIARDLKTCRTGCGTSFIRKTICVGERNSVA
jgi:hypothetical protein